MDVSVPGAAGIKETRSSIPPLAPRAPLPPIAAASSSSSHNRQGQQTLASIVFPPQLDEAEELIASNAPTRSLEAGGGEEPSSASSTKSLEAQVLALRRWRDDLLELLAAVARGSNSSSDAPVEEVWHWLVADDRLSRSLAFAEHAAVTELTRRLLAEGGQEAGEAVCRWGDATKQLKQLQKESSWNAQYLRVVEEPLQRLVSDEVIENDALPGLVKRLLRSLSRIFHSSDYFKEHRMASLLHKILKELVRKAGRHLPSPFGIAKPPVGFGASIRRSSQLRESFQAFIDNFFISEPSSNSGAMSSERRPATALGSKGDRSMLSARRETGAGGKDASSELGWWRATVRTSLEHAEHCGRVAERITGLMEEARWLAGALPSLRIHDAGLMQQAEGFLEIYGGVKATSDMEVLLDTKRRLEVEGQLNEVEERLRTLISKCKQIGAESEEPPDSYSLAPGGHAEVLTLPDVEAEDLEVAPLKPAPHTCGELQEDIANLRDDLRQFGSQLENLSDMVLQKGPRRLNFVPLSRGGEQGAAEASSHDLEHEGEDDLETVREAADRAAALEVAKRSSWYQAPPSALPEDCEVISVRQEIQLRPITDLPDRPRTGHPCLLAGKPPAGSRPSTAPCGTRPPSSHQDLVAERLGYTTNEENVLGGFRARGSPKGLTPIADEEPLQDESLQGGIRPSPARVCDQVYFVASTGLAEVAEEEPLQEEKVDEAARTAKVPLPPLDDDPSDSQLLELPDLGMDPFCTAAVSWNVS